MTIQLVPCFSDPSWFAQMTLEGTSYGLSFDYNQRCASWYLSIADAGGVDIVNGVKLVTGFFLLAKCKDPRRPPGELIVATTTADASPPQQYELVSGGRCALYYITSDWLAVMGSPGGVASLQATLAAGSPSSGTSSYGQG